MDKISEMVLVLMRYVIYILLCLHKSCLIDNGVFKKKKKIFLQFNELLFQFFFFLIFLS